MEMTTLRPYGVLFGYTLPSCLDSMVGSMRHMDSGLRSGCFYRFKVL